MKKDSLIKGFFVLVSAALAILTVDLFFQWYWRIPSPGQGKILIRYVPSLSPQKRLNPNIDTELLAAYREYRYHVTTDENGFRTTTPMNLNRATKNYDVIVLGDSQTFGTGVNDDGTFSSLLSNDLRLAVLNTAVPGYNNFEERELLKELLAQHSPKHVVLSLFIGNDPYENYKNRKMFGSVTGEVASEPESPKHENLLASTKDYLKRHSSLYNGLTRVRRIASVNELLYRFGLVENSVPGELAVFQKDHALGSKFLDLTEQIILDIDRITKEKRAQLTVLLIPDRIQIEPGYWDLWVEKYRIDASQYDLLAPNRRLADFCKKNNIPFIDPSKMFIGSYASGLRPYWKIDHHVAHDGHKLLALALAGVLGKSSGKGKA